VALIRYIDVALVVLAAPILLLIGVPALGYLVGAGAWTALRAIGIAVDRYANATDSRGTELTLRTAYPLARIFLLALAVILVRKGEGRDDGLTALLVIVFAFTVWLILSIVNRPRSR
jgi:hypothetical protein